MTPTKTLAQRYLTGRQFHHTRRRKLMTARRFPMRRCYRKPT
jgi:hypothetical protein